MKRFFLALFTLLFSSNLFASPHYATGLKVPQNWKLHARFSSGILGVDFPAKFDWKDKENLPPIKDQGQCGSCWAFASLEVQEALIAIQDKKIEALSAQELVSCDSSSSGCSGGYFTAFEYQKQKGLTYEKDFSYKAKDIRCDVSSLSHDYRIFDWGYIGSTSQSPSVDEIKAQIFAGGPVTATVCADNRFMNYHSGIFSGNAGCQNHMIVLEGWDDSSQSWLLRNSWGIKWGEKGFMHIKYGSNSVAQIAAFAVYKH